MKKKIIGNRGVFVFGMMVLLIISLVLAEEDSWDSFTDNSSLDGGGIDSSNTLNDSSVGVNGSDSVGTGDTSSVGSSSTGTATSVSTDTSSSESSFKYTKNFYIALGVGGVGVLIVILLVLSFVLRPRNRWKK